LVKAGKEEDIREIKGMLRAYHRTLIFLENAMNGGKSNG